MNITIEIFGGCLVAVYYDTPNYAPTVQVVDWDNIKAAGDPVKDRCARPFSPTRITDAPEDTRAVLANTKGGVAR